jgi:hypothetical protein
MYAGYRFANLAAFGPFHLPPLQRPRSSKLDFWTMDSISFSGFEHEIGKDFWTSPIFPATPFPQSSSPATGIDGKGQTGSVRVFLHSLFRLQKVQKP